MLKLRDNKTGQVIAFVARPYTLFSDLTEAVHYLKAAHNTNEIYVYTNDNDRDYILNSTQFHDLSRFSRIVKSIGARNRALRFSVEQKRNKKISLFLGLKTGGNYCTKVGGTYCMKVGEDYAFLTWDDYMYNLYRTITIPYSLTICNITLQTCNYLNLITSIYE